eukprot:Em0002g864a
MDELDRRGTDTWKVARKERIDGSLLQLQAPAVVIHKLYTRVYTAQKARPRSITLVLDSTLLALETSRLTLAILHYVLALFERAESNLNKVKRQVDSHTGRPRPSANARSF